MISMPQQSNNNLGSALALWNKFATPVGQSSAPIPAPQGGGQQPPPQLQTPQASDWALANSQAGPSGQISQPADTSGNLGKAAGAAAGGGLSGLLASI